MSGNANRAGRQWSGCNGCLDCAERMAIVPVDERRIESANREVLRWQNQAKDQRSAGFHPRALSGE
jgi:hypothetical protein